MGVKISKRQVVRLLTAKLETFRAEDEAVLKAGLGGAYVTVDDTGARHAGKSGYTTQIGSGSLRHLAYPVVTHTPEHRRVASYRSKALRRSVR